MPLMNGFIDCRYHGDDNGILHGPLNMQARLNIILLFAYIENHDECFLCR